MKIAICVDNNLGLLFNNRRQSRDKKVYEDMINEGGGAMCVTPFSLKLFKDDGRVTLFEKEATVLFLENEDPANYLPDELIIYHWNTVYPADTFLKLDLNEYEAIECTELCGSSHKHITKRRYIKKC